MDNYVVIGSKVDTEGVDKGITEIKRKFKDLDDIEIDVDDDLILEGMSDRIQELHEELKQLEGKHIIGDDERQRMQEIRDEITAIIDKANEMTGQHYIFKGITDVDDRLTNINSKLNKLGNGLEKVGRKVSKIGLSMLGIHSLYGMISRSVSRVKESNEEISTSISAINNVLDTIVGRLLQALLPFINMLVTGISIISKALFGIDVTSGEFSNNMKNANKNTSKLRKQLMGFDEMNILNEDGTTGLLGGTSGTAQTKQLEAMIEAGKKAIDTTNKWFKETQDEPVFNLLDRMFFGGAGTGWQGGQGLIWDILGVDVRPGSQDSRTKYYSKYFDKVKEIVKNGTAEIKGEYVEFTTEFGDKYMYTTLTWNRLLKDLEEGVATYGSTWYELEKEIIPKYNQQMRNALPNAVKEAVKQGIIGVKDLRTGWKTNIQDITKDIPRIWQAVREGNYEIKKDYVDITLASGETVRVSKEQFNELKEVVEKVANDIGVGVKQKTDEIKSNIAETGVKASQTGDEVETKINNVGVVAKQKSDEIKSDIIGVGVQTSQTGDGIVTKVNSVGVGVKQGFKEMQNSGETSASNTKTNWFNTAQNIINKFIGNDDNGVLGAVTGVFDELQQKGNSTGQETENTTITYTQETIDKMNKIINNYNPPTITLKTSVNLNTVQSKINDFVNNVKNLVGFTLSATGHTGGGRYGAKGLLIGPHLASGGIINRPGKGVPLAVGGAIAGERGREAVLPLTDTQQMQYLGREIAKNIVVNLTNVTELDGRIIARSINQVTNDINFASNGGVI